MKGTGIVFKCFLFLILAALGTMMIECEVLLLPHYEYSGIAHRTFLFIFISRRSRKNIDFNPFSIKQSENLLKRSPPLHPIQRTKPTIHPSVYHYSNRLVWKSWLEFFESHPRCSRTHSILTLSFCVDC